MARQLGTTPEKAVGLKCYECVHAAVTPPDNCPHAMLLQDGKQHTAEINEPQLGGDFIVSATPLKDDDGQLIGSVHVAHNITERKKAEAALLESQQRWVTTLTSIGDAVIATDLEGKVTFMNAVAQKLTGWMENQAAGKPIQQIFKIINVQTRKPVENPVVKVLEHGLVVGLANHTLLVRQDGTEVAIDDSGAPIKTPDGKTRGVVLVFRDITERKKDEKKLLRLNCTLRAISNSNQALMRSKDEQSFLQQACRIIVEDCGYKMVWVGLALDDEAKSVVPVAHAGLDQDYLKLLNVTWADTERGRGPTGRAVRTGHLQFCENIRLEPSFQPWRAEALKRGFVSSISLPLKSADNVFGAITMYSSEEGCWSQDEIVLLTELANDFAYGITMLRIRAGKERAEAEVYQQAALIDLSPDAILVRTFDGTITFWSKGAEKLYGWTKEEAIGKTSHELFKTKFPEAFNSIVCKLEADKQWSGELVHKTKSGREVYVKSWWLAEKTEHGQITSIMESNVDLTERKSAEQEIARLASFPMLNPSPVVEVDLTGKITYANPATQRLLPDLQNMGLTHEFFSDWEQIRKAITIKPNNTLDREVKIGEHWYHQQFYLVPQTLQVRIYSSDVDELKQAEEARATAQVKLEENAVLLEEYANQMEELANQRAQQLKDTERMAAIGQTAGMVGHDIRNPLQAITGDMYLITEELKSIPDGESKHAIQESIDAVNQNIVYINKIVSDLQDYTRPLKPSLQDINLSQLIEGIVSTITVPQGIEIEVNVEQNAAATRSDLAYLRRILTNLFTNAIQAMPNEGKLAVHATKENCTITITIQDTGVGIPEEVKQKMFTPLFTTKSKGQGLGLAVVKRLIESLGGTIDFESEPNKGTTFIIKLTQKP